MEETDYTSAHEHCIRHRAELLRSDLCGCFYCCQIFRPQEIQRWIDEEEGIGQTALCPKCSIDSVIGSASGFPITMDFLNAMNQRWF
jgi:hypothetical protein